MKYLMLLILAFTLIGCDVPVEFTSDTVANIYDNDKLVYSSECVAIATFDINDQNVGVLRLKDGKFRTIEVKTFNMIDKNHSYTFKTTSCK